MLHCQEMGMKCLPVKGFQGGPRPWLKQRRLGLKSCPVKAVAEQRVTQMGKMNANLMCSPRFEPQP